MNDQIEAVDTGIYDAFLSLLVDQKDGRHDIEIIELEISELPVIENTLWPQDVISRKSIIKIPCIGRHGTERRRRIIITEAQESLVAHGVRVNKSQPESQMVRFIGFRLVSRQLKTVDMIGRNNSHVRSGVLFQRLDE